MNHRDISPPIHVSSTYEVSWQQAELLAQGDDSIPFYARYGNPTTRLVEAHLRDLCAPPDEKENFDAIVTSSGMAAVSLVMLGLLGSGDEILASDSIYGGTTKLLRETLPRLGITTKFCRCDLSDASEKISPRTKLLWIESPTNPANRLVKFGDAVALARKHDLISCIDATLAPPPLQSPLARGFDLEMHSATKYLGGHSDLLAGAVIGRRDLIEKLRDAHRTFGAVLDPHAAFLLGRGLQTLEVRMKQINETALRLSGWLESQSNVARVHYLGLESHADHQNARAQMNGFSGIVAFDLADADAARDCVSRLNIIRHAPSLGGAETLVSYPPLSSHAGQSDAQLQAAGISRGTLRLAVGLESFEILRDDLAQSF